MTEKPGTSPKVARNAPLAHTSPPPVPNQSPLPVVCAIIEDDRGRVLIAQRPAHKHLGLKWEFPGGKVEPGESAENALRREIREELGCDLTLIRALPRFVHDYTAVIIEMIPFVCRLAPASPPPHPHEHVAVQWVKPDTLLSLDLAPADFPVVVSYQAGPATLDTPEQRG